MDTVPTQIRIEKDVKAEASELFNMLGIDMSHAINMFLRQCIYRGGLPFSVSIPQYKQSVLEAMEEAKRISEDPNAPTYNSLEELKEALED